MIRIIFPILFAAAILVSAPAVAQPVEIADDAPDTYVVVPGDTLWGISGRFLRQPWRWPEVWRLNAEEIRNPHLIYPGQVIMLDRSGPYLTIGRRLGPGDQWLSPRIYHEPLDTAITSIPLSDIEPFLTRPLVVDDGMLEDAGTIVATEEQRVFMGTGDIVFAKDVDAVGSRLEIFRKAKPLIDPFSNELLAYEAQYLGSARVVSTGEDDWRHGAATNARGTPQIPATLEILTAIEEIGTGDRVLPADRPRIFSFVPRAPQFEVEGRLIDIHRGVEVTGRHNVVTLNVGEHDGIEIGSVLALYRHRGEVVYEENGVRERFLLPEHRYGLVFVFRVFDRVAYALVMDSDGPVRIGDYTRSP